MTKCVKSHKIDMQCAQFHRCVYAKKCIETCKNTFIATTKVSRSFFFLHQKRAVNLLCFVTIPDIEWRDHLNVMLWWSICAFYFVLCAKHRFFFLSQKSLKFDTIDPILITYCKILYACFWSSIGVKHWLRPASINICIRTDKNACCCFFLHCLFNPKLNNSIRLRISFFLVPEIKNLICVFIPFVRLTV